MLDVSRVYTHGVFHLKHSRIPRRSAHLIRHILALHPCMQSALCPCAPRVYTHDAWTAWFLVDSYCPIWTFYYRLCFSLGYPPLSTLSYDPSTCLSSSFLADPPVFPLIAPFHILATRPLHHHPPILSPPDLDPSTGLVATPLELTSRDFSLPTSYAWDRWRRGLGRARRRCVECVPAESASPGSGSGPERHGAELVLPLESRFIVAHGPEFVLSYGTRFIITHGPKLIPYGLELVFAYRSWRPFAFELFVAGVRVVEPPTTDEHAFVESGVSA